MICEYKLGRLAKEIKKPKDLKPLKDCIVPTGIKSLDMIIGNGNLEIGGIRKGTVVEITGEGGVGKTTFALHLTKQYQQLGMSVLYIDTERTLSLEFLESMGIDMDKFYILNSDTLEDAFDACVCAASEFGMIVIDSLAALPTEGARNCKPGELSKQSLQDTITSAFSIITSVLADNECTLVIIDQFREDPHIVMGNPYLTMGEASTKYYASLRLFLHRIDTLGRDRKEIGAIVKIRIKKNKFAAVTNINCSCYAELHFGKGFYEVKDERMQRYDEDGNLKIGTR